MKRDMDKDVKVAVVRTRTVRIEGAYTTSDNDLLPTYGKATTAYRLYMSQDIADDSVVAWNAIKGITGMEETEPFVLKPDGPWVDMNESRILCKELSARAVELLSAALPQYTFQVADDSSELRYVLTPNGHIKMTTDITGSRHKVLKYVLWIVALLAIILLLRYLR